jgi:hypothetical protein
MNFFNLLPFDGTVLRAQAGTLNSGINFVRKNKHLQKNTTFVLFFIINLTLFSLQDISCNNWFSVQIDY